MLQNILFVSNYLTVVTAGKLLVLVTIVSL